MVLLAFSLAGETSVLEAWMGSIFGAEVCFEHPAMLARLVCCNKDWLILGTGGCSHWTMQARLVRWKHTELMLGFGYAGMTGALEALLHLIIGTDVMLAVGYAVKTGALEAWIGLMIGTSCWFKNLKAIFVSEAGGAGECSQATGAMQPRLLKCGCIPFACERRLEICKNIISLRVALPRVRTGLLPASRCVRSPLVA